jgi:hypothetical protein
VQQDQVAAATGLPDVDRGAVDVQQLHYSRFFAGG